jgi:porphobilinogen synthase
MEPWQQLDRADAAGAANLLRACCGSARWVDRMIVRRPFGSRESLLAAARDEWFALGPEDWREAFSHHPKIGDAAARSERFAATRHLSQSEQEGVERAGADLLHTLAEANQLYERTFGYIFIVSARGKSAEEMLALLHARLRNDPEAELRVAASEQADITARRLEGIQPKARTPYTIPMPTRTTVPPAAPDTVRLDLVRRPRRLRRSAALRALVRETRLSPENFIEPLFVRSGEGRRVEIGSMPGVYQLSVDEVVREAAAVRAAGIPGVLLFGLPDEKDAVGSSAYDPDAPVQAAVRAIKQEVQGLLVVTDVCLCEYTSHGHCGVLVDDEVANDATVEQLVRAALSHAAAGADVVAPSDMMDGRVGRIREALDGAGFGQVAIMSYAAKYCSAFYGPFREAADSAPAFGDRRSHQMDPANVEEALREVELDIEEGADIVMVKPAMTYLDVIARVKAEFGLPTAAYHVSGEYAMLKAAARNGWIDEPRAMMETLTAIRRAGADIIITYYAREAARAL